MDFTSGDARSGNSTDGHGPSGHDIAPGRHARHRASEFAGADGLSDSEPPRERLLDGVPGAQRDPGDDQPLVTVLDRSQERRRRRRFRFPTVSRSAALGVLAVVVVGAGAIHLSTRGTAIELDPAAPPTVAARSSGPSGAAGGATTGTSPDAAAGTAASVEAPSSESAPATASGSEAGSEQGSTATGTVVVHVTGAVQSPGIV